MCYSLLMYLQDKFNVTTTTDIEVVKSLLPKSDFDIILLDTEPSKEIQEICMSVQSVKRVVPIILTYVYQNHIKELDSKIRPFVNSVFYKPFDLTEVANKLATLAAV